MMTMVNDLRPALAVLTALLASGLVFVLGERVHRNVREAITFAAAFLMAGLVYSMLPDVLQGREVGCVLLPILTSPQGGVQIALRADAAGMVFACVSSTLWIFTSLYSVGYMRGHGEQNQTGYYSAFAMCLAATMGICFAANLITFFIFFEILTLATYPLVVHYRDEEGTRSGRKYLAYTLISGQLMFASIVVIYIVTGSMDFVPGGFVSKDALPLPWLFVCFFLMVGAGLVKAGVMPLHSWLPAAMVAPTPVSALLHAVAVVKAGAFCTLRMVLYVFGPETAAYCHGAAVLAWMAVFTILASSLVAIRKDNLKARLAFSTVGQLSYIVLGIAILTPASAAGALYHIVAHAFMKITLFMCAGAIFVTTHKKDISEMRGLGRRMPVTFTCFAIASLGIAGLPLLAGFVSKMNILRGAWTAFAEDGAAGGPLFVATLVCAALLALTYLIPVVVTGFARPLSESAEETHGHGAFGIATEASYPMLVPILCTACLSVIFGVAPNAGLHLYDLSVSAADSIFEALRAAAWSVFL